MVALAPVRDVDGTGRGPGVSNPVESEWSSERLKNWCVLEWLRTGPPSRIVRQSAGPRHTKLSFTSWTKFLLPNFYDCNIFIAPSKNFIAPLAINLLHPKNVSLTKHLIEYWTKFLLSNRIILTKHLIEYWTKFLLHKKVILTKHLLGILFVIANTMPIIS